MGELGEPNLPENNEIAMVVIGRESAKILARMARKLPRRGRPKKPSVNINKRPKGVPDDWVKRPSRDGNGYKWVKPGTKGSTDVRIQKGDPNSQYPNSREPYIRWKKDGKWLDKNGNPLPNKKDPRGHIPIDEFDFKGDIFK